ncbi:hypothetical protein SAMN05518672_103625 [Chitinophaga sp. CF118]|uniref:hypothetical protein n=1 Tax=Chitinophaga sp. CF118 TaxID=1884367 RepID=UPI0008E307F4|nr:hypothetical protein [Chitinophaga sp. CF118]SFD87322.1 hypothetical protein SAMN05518672_103625 [Chitinophaga sp. CF118]
MKVEINNALTSRLEEENFSDMESIDSRYFPDDIYDIKKNIDKIVRAAIEKIKNALCGYNDTEKDPQTRFKNRFNFFLNPHIQDLEFVEACLKKAEVGLNKLRIKKNDKHPNLRYIIYNTEESLVALKTRWIPMLEEHREKKKKRNRIIAMVIILLHVIIYGGLYYLL